VAAASQGFWQRILGIDRRWIFLLVGIGVTLPLLFPVNLPVAASPRVKAAYQAIESVPEGSRVLVSLDYEPDIMAELQPMSIAVLRHCFRRHLKPVILTLYPAGPGLIEQALAVATAAEGGRVRGVDYTFLGYKSGNQAVILGLGENMHGLFPKDFYGTSTDSIPLMKGANSFTDFPLLIDLSGSTIADYYIRIGASRYHRPMVLGSTAVMASDYYPYLSSGQIKGLIGGMKGAAEYERLIGIVGDARHGMDAQSLVHVIVVLLVLLGNAALFATGGAKPRMGGGA
jgi:hypothetical protein